MKSILIVAAERGLGLGLAEQFFKRGWSVVGTARSGADTSELRSIGAFDAARLDVLEIDVTKKEQIAPFAQKLGERTFDVLFMNAGIFGPVPQNVENATDEQFAEIMLTNCFGPIRLARNLLAKLKLPGGTLCFMSSHRGSIEMNDEAGLTLDLYRASKVATNMLSRTIYADNQDKGLTVLSIHPGWAATTMGTLDGAVEAEISVEESVTGVASVVEENMGSGKNLYLDYKGNHLPW